MPARTIAPVTHALGQILEEVRHGDHPGKLADYIPELAHANPDDLAASVMSVLGHRYDAGDVDKQFTIQSISKPFVYALALAEHGMNHVLQHVGVEPSGQAFNAISFDASGRPFNPMINAGALVTTSLIEAADATERFARIHEGLSAFAGHRLELDQQVYQSESQTGDRNRALAMLARAAGTLQSPVDDVTEPYFQQCSLLVDAGDLAVMAATLSNNGVNPLTGVEVVPPRIARHILSLMASCGMYDRSGEWLFRAGLPAKSGVGGGIIAVSPGEYGISVYSPPLDSVGNSSRGVALLERLSGQFRLHMFGHATVPLAPIVESQSPSGALAFQVHGELDFVTVEQLIHTSLLRIEEIDADGCLFDLSEAGWASYAARRLMAAFVSEAAAQGLKISVDDPKRVLEQD